MASDGFHPETMDVAAICKLLRASKKYGRVRAVKEPIWVVHFSDEAAEIARDGFRHGNAADEVSTGTASAKLSDAEIANMSFFDRLQYYAEQDRKPARTNDKEQGLNYAAPLDDRESVEFWGGASNKAVVFQAAGGLTYNTDGFYQLVFDGSSVRPPLALIESDDHDVVSAFDRTWRVVGEDFSGSLSDVLAYVRSAGAAEVPEEDDTPNPGFGRRR